MFGLVSLDAKFLHHEKGIDGKIYEVDCTMLYHEADPGNPDDENIIMIQPAEEDYIISLAEADVLELMATHKAIKEVTTIVR